MFTPLHMVIATGLGIDNAMVKLERFELPTSTSQTWRFYQAELQLVDHIN